MSSKNLIDKDSILIDIIKTEIFNNKNLNAKINLNLKDIIDINELNNLLLKLRLKKEKLIFQIQA